MNDWIHTGVPAGSQRNGVLNEVSQLGFRPSISALRVVISVACVALALLLIGYLTDWSQLKLAVRQLGGQPWLLAVLIFAYTGAFFLRAIAWRALWSGSVGLYGLFVSIQTGLLVIHLTPLKLGEIARPLLAARQGMSFTEAATTTAIARYLDFAALLAIAVAVGTAVSLSAGTQLWLEDLALPVAVILGCGAIPLGMRQPLSFRMFPGFLRVRLQPLQHQLRQVSVRQVVNAAIWTLPSWALEAAVIIIAAKALGVELSLAAAVAVTAFIILLGSRYLGTRERQPLSGMIANRAFTWLMCLASGRRITDGQTGFRAFSRRALECAEIIHDCNYAQVLTLDLLRKGMRMREIPVSYRFRTK